MFFAVALPLGFEALTASQQIPSEQQHNRAEGAKRGAEVAPATLDESHASEQATKRKEKQAQAAEHALEFLNIKLSDAIIALFTVVLAVKTAGLFKETAGLREATFKLYEAGERQLELTRKSADTAKESADVAKATLESMRDTAQRQLRAYLVVEALPFSNFEAGKTTLGHFSIRNVGQTPPHGVIMGTGVIVVPRGYIPAFDKPTSDQLRSEPNSRNSYFANEIKVDKNADRTFSQQEIDAVLSGASRLCVGGRVYYRDIFNNEWHTDFVYVSYGPDAATMIPEQYPTGNDGT
ncbi:MULTISPECIES: hypothetical protein [Bradyrhizobium]|uniref:Uncharacterized protein n=1 Tax=Bradyrhizobium brasilense TaxID=1419277 RepID=A0ABY8JS86_9BRAD|nr:hypothetical protein [Bradyrhizobium brasilense]WFU67714.1 hypothetical protein QA636_20370 [Bradyrhizobium brasilense]